MKVDLRNSHLHNTEVSVVERINKSSGDKCRLVTVTLPKIGKVRTYRGKLYMEYDDYTMREYDSVDMHPSEWMGCYSEDYM